jgi:CheY-like chemotaxis protein
MSAAIDILLVDDDDINNFLSREIISLYVPQAEVSETLSAEAALELLKQNAALQKKQPDIILLDINMPLMSGWDFVEAFEQMADNEMKKIKLYIYTSSVYYKDFEKARSYRSVTNIYSKPLTETMLKEICFS